MARKNTSLMISRKELQVKILHVVTQMEAGGAQGAAIRNAEFMRERGIDSSVIFLYRKRGVYDNYDHVHVLLERPPKSGFDYIAILFMLFNLLRREKPKSIISYTHYANVMAGLVGRCALVPKVVASHRNPSYTYPKLCRIADKIIGSLGFYSVSICVSNTIVESFRSYPMLYRKRLRLIRNGVDLSCYNSSSASDEEGKGSDGGGCFKFITVGRLHHQKNHKVLFDAMRNIQHNSVELIVVGDGELRKEYEEHIANQQLSHKVKLIGEVPPVKVKEYIQSSDVFLFPSHYEAFGFAVVEAMAAGLPVVCSDISAMREIVGDAGILLPKDDPGAWSKVMVQLIGDHTMRDDMSSRSQERARRYSLEAMAEGYIDAATN
jgi:glycosyltransferase involved in cell wall biosynthesis